VITNDSPLPLAGVVVVDLSSNIAAPFGAAILADLGAEVVHIEPPTGDDSRRMSPTKGDTSAFFYVVNRNKTFVTLDLRLQKDQEALFERLGEADVLVSNLRPHKLATLGLDAPTLAVTFPGLITAFLNAYGAHPDELDQAGYDGVIQARTGIIGVTGATEPARAGVSILDMGSGMWLAIGVLSALYQKTITGLGSSISTSLFETGVNWSAYHLLAHQFTGAASTRAGTGHPAFAPYGLFPTRDGQVMIGVGGDAVFTRLVNSIGLPELVSDPRFADNSSRVLHQAELTQILSVAFTRYSSNELITVLRRADVPSDLLALPEDLLDDPAAQEQLTRIVVDGQDPMMPSLPLRINGEYPPIKFPS
jgi:crotonobetainyl-CoA:carnitine CoA-transferase CaiB-like acyl-CoA transferase